MPKYIEQLLIALKGDGLQSNASKGLLYSNLGCVQILQAENQPPKSSAALYSRPGGSAGPPWEVSSSYSETDSQQHTTIHVLDRHKAGLEKVFKVETILDVFF